MRIEQELAKLGFEMPTPKPLAAYVPAVRSGDLVFTAGQGPTINGVPKWIGKVGRELTEEQGYLAAQLCAVNCLACVKSAIGDLDKVEHVVKLLGFVASVEGFSRQPWVMNGASELLIKLFGERGRHARSAIGTNQLPLGIPCEVEMIVRVRD
ncbi:MAG TPA: RidA family protein [Candidatus Sulfotelmatobacter sp.]|nr:RidA family protein [Candidatus Sulfotelmatobacter sp.]